MPIVRLSEEVINKIAAGEVADSPAAIVKELVENSIDAHATRIDIELLRGGEELIRIVDDGCGMGPEDALLSLERHATSKIKTEKDLFQLTTMGFRGEALAAIAAVSRFEMITADGERGTRIFVTAGQADPTEPCARNKGTTIAVQDLFFNVPVRKKFLKSTSANVAQIVRVTETIALAHPTISFSLRSERKILVEVFATDRKKRIEALLGIMPHEVLSPSIWGVLAPAAEAKTHRRGQYLFVNKRPVFSPLVSRAVKAGYGTRIAENAFPSFVLFLEIAPDAIDVNVHPQKKEIRFADEQKIFHLFEEACSSVFQTLPSFTEHLVFSDPLAGTDALIPPVEAPQRASQTLLLDFPVVERPLAIVEEFLLLQAKELLLIDLRAAHARILYESLSQNSAHMHNNGASPTMQMLMWPWEIYVESEETVLELQKMGIECRMIGKKKLAIDAVPLFFELEDFQEFVQAWQQGKKLDAAIQRCLKKTKKQFTLEEAMHLWARVRSCQETVYDPFGKKIWNRVDKELLQRLQGGT